jgi:hypothetical protein
MSLLSRLAVQAARAYGILSSADKNKVAASYLVVAGGGGGAGGTAGGGGGGAGGYQTSTFTLSTLNTYSIAVGAGGNGGAINTIGSQGSSSVISGTGLTTVTSVGGGYGGYNNVAAGSGGSGGGGGGRSTTNRFGGSATSGQGNAGGDGLNDATNQSGAGGGGAGAVGGNASGSSTGGAGGNGLSSSISGSSVTYAGGGGGAGYYNTAYGTTSNGGLGGTGGGGTANSAGTVNLGGGGGGGGGSAGGGGAGAGAAGGSGVVIISYASATPKFVGGTLTTSGGNQIHTFTSSGTLSPLTPVTASYLVVAGGGGGAWSGGGGGAGGLLTSSTTLYSGATYVVTVGAGGTNGTSGSNGSNGSDSSLNGTGLTTVTSTGGGRGGNFSNANTGFNNGASGGSGGGGGSSDTGYTAGTGGSGTSGQGNAGAAGRSFSTTGASGGGGGAGGAGAQGTNGGAGGVGGVGLSSSISGTSTFYAGGGAGGGAASASGGNGGGGNSNGAGIIGSPGTANTGGGGGAGGNTTGSNGGAGGSGVVIISYAGSQVFNGGLVTSSGGNTIHTFTATGALTPLTNNLNNSLRFRSSASAYLNRTPSVAGNRQKFTWSGWVKFGQLATTSTIFSVGATSTVGTYFEISKYSTELINIADGTTDLLRTTQVFRDPSAWYHIVVAVDTTNATADNRVILYVNGSQVTAFNTRNNPTLNANLGVNNTNIHYFGTSQYSGTRANFFDGYMADINFIDGQALEPYYFGNNDANGVWKPIQYKGTYGTNGFYLTFGNTTSTTTLGYDSSPNGNNWTCNNISLTAGTTYDAMTDVPTNTSATVANYAVMNPLIKTGAGSLSNANLTISGSDFETWGTMAFPTTGSYYYEFTVASTGGGGGGPQVGISTFDGSYNVKYARSGSKIVNGTSSAYGNSWSVGDVIGVAYNATTSTVTFYRNNTSQGNITATSDQVYAPYAFDNASGMGSINFGQRPFSYTPPTGFVALNTYNLPTPTILQGNKYMDATLYTSTGTSQVVVNQGQFKPDFVWTKVRGTTSNHTQVDSVRGASKYLVSNTTAAEDTAVNYVTSFNSNGFSLGSDNYSNGNTLVAWQWQAGQGSTSSNTQGTITTTTSVNTTAGFSVFTFTGTGASSASVGHGLGVAPKFMIFKQRNGSSNWNVLTNAGGSNQYGFLNLTTAFASAGETWTSTVINIGANFTNGSTYVCYAWAEIAGFSKFGSYTGNGSADGPFVYLGFRPEFIMVKRSDSGNNWVMEDSSRSPFNVVDDYLAADSSQAESTTSQVNIDFLSNGFKLRSGFDIVNAGTYIYMAFAEHPFKNSNAR